MKKIIIFLPVILVTLSAFAQKYDSWKIFHNRKEAGSFDSKKETDEERKVVLFNRLLDGPGFFVIEYTPAKEQAKWIRSIAFLDKNDKTIKEYNNTLRLQMHNTEIGDIMEGQELVKVYSWAIPDDPELAAKVRVRRILLCTLYTR